MNQSIFVAPEGLEEALREEIGRVPEFKIEKQWGNLFLVTGPYKKLIFAQNTWLSPRRFEISSISSAAKILRSHGKLWIPCSAQFHRRTLLIQEQLPIFKGQEFQYGDDLPSLPLGAWFLEDDKTLWLSAQTSSAFPNGIVPFIEDRSAPSRAYLKLWEFFTLSGRRPLPSAKCLDLGSSPGGWTWVLAQLGCEVIAVDKAPLASTLGKNKRIQSLKKDAFTLAPETVGPIDWLFSDLICYPPKLYELIEKWRSSGLVKNFVCTIKFQGKTDFNSLDRFLALPGSQIQHLSANKHEVTWSLLDKKVAN